MGDDPANLGSDRAQRQALAAKREDLLDRRLLFGYFDQRTIVADLPSERCYAAEETSALLLIGLGT